jgi:hypothetical protein
MKLVARRAQVAASEVRICQVRACCPDLLNERSNLSLRVLFTRTSRTCRKLESSVIVIHHPREDLEPPSDEPNEERVSDSRACAFTSLSCNRLWSGLGAFAKRASAMRIHFSVVTEIVDEFREQRLGGNPGF